MLQPEVNSCGAQVTNTVVSLPRVRRYQPSGPNCSGRSQPREVMLSSRDRTLRMSMLLGIGIPDLLAPAQVLAQERGPVAEHIRPAGDLADTQAAHVAQID